MPVVARTRVVPAPPERVWDLVSDPHSLPRWWPDTERVEDASALAWTKVMKTPRGRTVRADFTREQAAEPRTLRWRQEIDETPFEGILHQAVTEVALEREGEGTRVRIEQRQKLRGKARFGSFLFRRATGRKLDSALDRLEEVV